MNHFQFKKLKALGFALFTLLLPGFALAQATIYSVSLSNTLPPPGGSESVTVVYCEATAYNNTHFLVAISSFTTFQTCSNPQQMFLVDGDNTAGPANPLTSALDELSDTNGQGWNAGDGASVTVSNNCPAGSVTQVFNVTIPSGLATGAYNIVVGAQVDDAQCTNPGSLNSQKSVPVNVSNASLPPSITLDKTAVGDSAQAGDLVLFKVAYTAINANPMTITDTIPPNTSLASGTSSTISPGGTLISGTGGAGSVIQWVFNNTGTTPSGYVWFLTQVSPTFTTGTITNTAAAASSSTGTVNSNQVSVQVGGDFELTKTILGAPATVAGQTVTYALNYTIGQASLQVYDSYNNDSAPTTTMDGSNIKGYDGTGYTAGNTNDIWEVQNNATVPVGAPGDGQYIDVETDPTNVNNTSGYTTLLRNSPISICGGGTFLEEGNIEIPCNLQNGTANAPGEDATMVLLANPAASANPTWSVDVILSLDNAPGNLAVQINDNNLAYSTAGNTVNSPGFQSPTMNSYGTGKLACGVWYTVESQVTLAGGNYTIDVKAWPVGTAEPAGWDLNNITITTANLPCTNFSYGWEGDPSSSGGNYTAGRQLYTNLSIVSADPVVNPTLSDTVPAGETYVGGSASQAPNAGTSLVWNLGGAHPVTVYDLSGAITWAAAVTCNPAQQVNVSEIAGTVGGVIQALNSNSVTTNLQPCITYTPTPTPTNTNTPTPSPTKTPTPTYTNTPTPTNTFTPTPTPTFTFTPTPSPTYTNTPTPTNTPTMTPTKTFTNTPTPTPTITLTPTPTPIITNTPTNTPTVTPTYTNTYTPTNTFTPTPTVSPTDTFTDTPTPTDTSTPTPTPSPTDTPTNTPTTSPFPTNTPTDTFTPTPSPTDTSTPTPTTSPTSTNTPTNTPTWTPTVTATNTPTNTFTPTVTATPTPTDTPLIAVAITKSVSNTQPAGGSALTYTIGVDVNPSTATGVTITDTVPAGMQYTGSTSNPAPTVVALPTVGPTPGTGTLLVWVFPTLNPGNYSLPYTTLVNGWDAGGLVMKNQAAVVFQQNPTPQIVQAPVTVQGQYTVSIDVFNSAGEIIKTLPIAQYSQAIENVSLSTSNIINSLESKINIIYDGQIIGTWDGTTNEGLPASNGQYYIKIDNVDLSGNVTTVTQPAIVNRSIAQLSIAVYNSAGEKVRSIVQTVADSLVLPTQVQLSSQVISPSYQGGSNSTTTLTLSSGATYIWDGRDDAGNIVGNGQYYFEIQSTNGQGGSSVFTQSVVVLHGGLNVIGNKIVMWPNPTNPDRYGHLLNFQGDSNMNLTLSIKVYTIAGELAHVPFTAIPGTSSGTADISGLASGLYIVDIEASNASGATQRQISKLAVLH